MTTRRSGTTGRSPTASSSSPWRTPSSTSGSRTSCARRSCSRSWSSSRSTLATASARCRSSTAPTARAPAAALATARSRSGRRPARGSTTTPPTSSWAPSHLVAGGRARRARRNSPTAPPRPSAPRCTRSPPCSVGRPPTGSAASRPTSPRTTRGRSIGSGAPWRCTRRSADTRGRRTGGPSRAIGAGRPWGPRCCASWRWASSPPTTPASRAPCAPLKPTPWATRCATARSNWAPGPCWSRRSCGLWARRRC
mmetsp:Transcript_115565/g.323125  ORF Transcript_115565/g.323125 Transcript_115565/m.323125 type:complete len:253 (-) Transcript_115565:295-1053(-)